MPLPLRLGAFAAALAFALPAAAQEPMRRKGDVWDADDYEDTALLRAAERIRGAADTEGKRWERELAKAYPERFRPGLTEDDVAKWFDLLAGESKEWRRDAAPTKAVADLFDRVAQKMELGPVPSIRREEFQQFAKGRLAAQPARPQRPEERSVDADRAFRILDRDGSGSLEAAEWTERIRNDLKKADADGNRRISLEEYREHFARKVAEAAEATTAAAAKAESAAKPGKGPKWFETLDTDGDGQIGLYEWRAANRPVEEFLAMDLDGDGLLPPSEYQRYLAKVADAERSQALEKRPVVMPPEQQRAGMEKKPPQ
ncbi:MAG: hypothetical protein U0791_10470 [Gemmataceae bacterium]